MKTKGLLKTILGLALGTGLTVAAWAAPAVVEKGSIAFVSKGILYAPCLDAWLYEVVNVDYNYHQVTTPNGNFLYHDLYMHFTGTSQQVEEGEDGQPVLDDDGNAVLVPGGVTLTLKNNVSPYHIRIGKGMVEHYTAWSTWVTEDGAKVQFQSDYHITVDANGEVRVERGGVLECSVKD